MRASIHKKTPILPVFLSVILLILCLLSVLFFLRIDHIVHTDLYGYGLSFSFEWANQYWAYSGLLLNSIYVAFVVVIASIFLTVAYGRTRKTYFRNIACVLFVFGAVMIGIAAFSFVQLDYFVHSDLYRYGLQFSTAWADQYWSYSRPLDVLLWSAAALGPIVAGLVFFSDRLQSFHPLAFARLNLISIAFRNIPRRKLRNSLTVLAIVLGVTLMVGVNVAFDNVYSQFRRTVNQAAGEVDISIRSTVDVPFNESVLATVESMDGVADAYGRTGSIVNASVGEDWVSATLVGVNSATDFDYLNSESTNITGTRVLGVNSADAVVDEGLNYAIGEVITLNVTTYSDSTFNSTEYNFTVVGIYSPNSLAAEYMGQFGSMDYSIFIDIERAQAILDYGNKIDSVSLKLTDINDTDQVLKALDSKLGADYVINPIKSTLLGTIEKATSGLKSGLQIMSVMALCVAIVIVLNTMYMNVGERTHEIGILRSQGASTRQVFWIFFSESLTLGIIGVIIGLFTGMMSTNVFRYLTQRVFQPFTPGFETNFVLFSADPQHLVLGASAGILTVIIGGVFPSLSACKTDIINALRPSMRKAGNPRTALKLVALGLPLTIAGAFIYLFFDYFSEYGVGLFIASAFAPIPMIGVTLLCAGLLRSGSGVIERLLLLFGRTRKVISRNIERNLLRSTICFALIGMSLNLVIVMGGAQTGTVMGVENVIRSFSSSDLTVISKTTIPSSFADNLTNVDGTLINITTPVLVVPERTILENHGYDPVVNSSSSVMAIDPSSYDYAMSMSFTEDTPSDVFVRLNDSGTVILTSPLAKSLNASIGDEVKMAIFSLVEVPVVIPNPALADVSIPANIPDISGYGGGVPGGSGFDMSIPSTITINVTKLETTRVNFTVVGIAQGAWLELVSLGRFPLSEACYISYNSLNETYPDYMDESNLFFLKVNSGQNVDYARDQIESAFGDTYQLSVTTYNDAVDRVRSSIDEIFYILYSVVVFAVVNASIGVAAIMIMNVSERKREIGILRSQGMSRLQIVALIIGEAACLGVVGFLSGTMVGLIFHRITVSYMWLEGFPMAFLIPYAAIAVSFVLAITTSIISAIYPANRASKLDIVDALRN